MGPFTSVRRINSPPPTPVEFGVVYKLPTARALRVVLLTGAEDAKRGRRRDTA